MKEDRKTKAARKPARSKTNKAQANGKAAGKKPGRAAAPAMTTAEQVPGAKKTRRRAQEELVGTRQRLMVTYEHAPIGIVECSIDGRHLNVNQEFCRLTGYSREELLDRGIRDLTYEEDYIFDIKLHQRLVEGQIPFYKLEKRYVRKDGELIWVELTRNIVCDADGKGLFTIGAAVDVTERKLAEEGLQLARYQAEQAAARIARLQEVTAALSEAVTSAQVARIVVEQGAPALGAVTGTAMLLAEDGETLEMVHTTSAEAVTRPYQRLSISLNVPAADAARTGEPVWIESRDQYLECYPHLAEQIAAWGYQAALAVPMVDKGHTLGVLALSFDRIMSYTPEDQEYALTLARQGAQALERARLYEAEQQARRAVMEFAGRQEVLYRLADQLHHTKSLEDIFDMAQDAIFSALRCDRASILLYDDTSVMRFVAWRGLSDDYRRATEGHSPWQPDIKDPEPISIEDVATAELDDALRAVIQREGIGSLAFIPLVSNDKLIGKFMVYFNRRHTFSEAELDLSLTIARQLAFGIDRKRAEENLRTSEERYRAVVESQAEMLCRFRRDGTILFVNRAYARARGSTPEELMRGNFWEFVPEEDRPGVEALLDSLTPGAPEAHVENRFQTVDGERWTLWTNRALSFDADGRMLEAQSSGIDITERKRAEEALRESEERFRTLSNAMPSIVWTAAPDGTITFANDQWYEYTGISPEESSRNWPVVLHPDDYERCMRAWVQALETVPDEYLIEIRNRRHDGQYRWFQTRAVPIRDASGKATAWYGVTTDIHDRIESENALRASEEEVRRLNQELQVRLDEMNTLLEILPIGVWIGNHDNSVITGNRAAYEMLGFPQGINVSLTHPEPGTPTGMRLLVGGKEVAPEDAPMQQVARTGKPLYNLEHEIILPDGTRKAMHTNIVPLLDEQGHARRVIGAYTDITERKQAEKRLALLAEISEMNRTIEDPRELMFAVSKAVGEHLRARRCLFNETDVEKDLEIVYRDYHNGVESVAGVHKLSDYSSITSAEMISGKTVVNTDSKIDPRTAQDYERSYVPTGERAYVAVPLMRENRWVATLWVSDDQPREWSKEEISLLETIAERTWTTVEKLRINRALRASESLYRTIARSIPGGGVYVVDKDFRYVIAEGPVTEAFGLSREMLEGRTVGEAFPDERGKRMEARLRRTFAGEMVSFETKHNGRVYWTQQAPLLDSLGHAIIVTLDITDRKQAEEALRESEERFVRFMQYLPGLAWIKDIQGRYVYVNDAAEKAFNTSREKLYGKTDEDIFPAEVAAQFKRNDEQSLVDGNGIQVIETLEHEDGVVHYSLVSKFPIPGPDGSPALIGGTAFDITERRQAEDALRESEERYRNLFELVPVAVYTCDARGLIQEYNHRAVELWGREPRRNDPAEKYCGSLKIFYPDGRFMPHEACPMSRVLAGETLEPHELEVMVERPDGVRRNVVVSPLPLRNEQGEIVAAINCLYDITERKQAEQALQELNQQLENRVRNRTARLQATNQALRQEIAEREQAEELLRRWAHIFEHADWGIATVYQDILTMVNPTYAKMHGYTVEELVGRNIYEIFAPDTHAEIQEQIRIAYERGHHIFESRQLRKDGSVFPVLVDTTVVRDEEGNVLYRAVNVQDITERKRVERELHESRARLQVLSRRLVEVQEDERRAIARELHDRVGQTLAALNINLIIMEGQLSADSKELVGSRLDDSLKLVAETIGLVRNVMTDLRPAVLDDYGLEAALQSYIDDYKSRYGIQAFLNPSDTPIPRLDPGLEMTLLRIGQEALTNAARHAQARQVRVSLQMIDHSIRLMVQDDGVGMDSSQGASSPKSHGLKIMRERAEAFGGTVTLESTPGKGTRVEARIPIQSGAQNKPSEEMHL